MSGSAWLPEDQDSVVLKSAEYIEQPLPIDTATAAIPMIQADNLSNRFSEIDVGASENKSKLPSADYRIESKSVCILF